LKQRSRILHLTLSVSVLLLGAGCAISPQHGGWPVPEGIHVQHAAVAADHPLASQAGLEMLRRGGNAVDAAVATSFCLSVVRPFSCGIGGGGFMIIHVPADESGGEPRPIAINYRETAPAAVGPDYYINLDDDLASRFGVHASGVPGTVAGLCYALEQYGTLDLPTVLAPAIRAAENGFAADDSFVRAAEKTGERLNEHRHLREHASYIWTQLCHEGAIEVGDRITNPQQARALRLIADHGADAFYRGAIGRAITAVMDESGGPITLDDLAGYEIDVTEPLRGSFRGDEILSMPPPSSGGIATLEILGLLERVGVDPVSMPHNSPAYVHHVTEAMKHAFADRAAWLADAAFVEVPTDRLLSDAYLDELAARIDPDRTLDPYEYGSVTPAPADGGTSHISVIDADGMAVACTETINLEFGSLVAVPGFGFALNDEMDDFTTIPGEPNAYGLRQSDKNLPEPGKRPLSSMSPTIVLRDGRAVVIAGASGGPRIITGTLQCILNCLLYDMTPQEAVAQARFHHQWMPNRLYFEDAWEDEATIEALEALGHERDRRREIGVVQVIGVGRDGIRAASDPRKGGRPAGY
jgi:gamma-glutamyltranspeptidase/glutathione hydrolase